MRMSVVGLGVLLTAPAAAAGQANIGIQVGVVATSNLVRDSIVVPIAVRPNLAPQLGARVTFPLSGAYRAGVAAQVSRSDVVAHEDGTTRSLVGLTVWEAGVLLERRMTNRLAADVSVGVLVFDPAFRRGTLFQDGAPRPLAFALGLRLEQPVAGRLAASLRVRYDLHRFNTPRLQAEGFLDARYVHRLALGVALTQAYGASR